MQVRFSPTQVSSSFANLVESKLTAQRPPEIAAAIKSIFCKLGLTMKCVATLCRLYLRDIHGELDIWAVSAVSAEQGRAALEACAEQLSGGRISSL